MFKIKSIDGVEIAPQEEAVQENETFTENEQVENVNTNQEEVQENIQSDEGVSEGVNEGAKLVFEKDEDLIEYVRSKNLIEEKKIELPSEIEGYLKYKQETNRSLQDYLELQKDLKEIDEQTLIKNYLKVKNPEYTDDEIQEEFEDTYGYDEDLDDEKEIKRKTRSYKKTYSEALEYFNNQKEQYKTKIEVQSEVTAPQDYEELKTLRDNLKANEQKSSENYEYFIQKTNEVFSDKFEGFKFKVGNEELVHKPTNVDNVKSMQSDLSNFFKKFVDENGRVKDAEAYHKALYVALNYESILANVYETAKAKAIEQEVKDSKNINMDGLRTAPEGIGKKVKFKVVQ